MNNREIEEEIQKIMTVVKTPRYPEFIFDVHDAVTKLREIASQKFPDGNVDLYRHLSIVIASTKEAFEMSVKKKPIPAEMVPKMIYAAASIFNWIDAVVGPSVKDGKKH